MVGGWAPTTLAGMRVGQSGEVVAVEAPDQAGYRRLFALGLVPGARVTLLQRFPTYVFTVGRTTIAVDAGMAAGIEVMAAPARKAGRGMMAPARKVGRGMLAAGDGDREPGDGFMDDPTEARPNAFCMEISIPRLLCPACRLCQAGF